MKQLPARGRWHFRGGTPFTAIEVDLNRGRAYLEETQKSVRHILQKVTVISAHKFGAMYSTAIGRGLVEGSYEDNRTLAVDFVGTPRGRYIANPAPGSLIGLCTSAPLAWGTALAPAAGCGTCIMPTALQKADLIVSAGLGAVSGVIRGVTSSNVSHAALYAGGRDVIEAIGEGVMRRDLDIALLEPEEASKYPDGSHYFAVAYRVQNITPAIADRVVSVAMQWLGKKYDVPGAIGGRQTPWLDLAITAISPAAGIASYLSSHGKFKSSDRFYCSQLVFEAYKEAGLPIGRQDPNTSNPNNIPQAQSSGILQYVGHLMA